MSDLSSFAICECVWFFPHREFCVALMPGHFDRPKSRLNGELKSSCRVLSRLAFCGCVSYILIKLKRKSSIDRNHLCIWGLTLHADLLRIASSSLFLVLSTSWFCILISKRIIRSHAREIGSTKVNCELETRSFMPDLSWLSSCECDWYFYILTLLPDLFSAFWNLKRKK